MRSGTDQAPRGAPWTIAARRRLLASVLLCTAISCSPATRDAVTDDASSHRFSVTREAGVTTARNTGGPRFSGELFRYDKVVELAVDDGNPESVLHGARSFTMSADGFFYVADTRRHRIAVFDPAGKYVRSFGREGDGPGDLRSPQSIENIAGLLYVPGSRGQRTTVFDTDGNVVDVLSHNTGRRPTAMYRGPDGELVVVTEPVHNDGRYQSFSAHVAVIDGSGAVVAEVGTEAVAYATNASREVDGQRLMYIAPLHYVASAQALYRSGELLLIDGREPLLQWFGLDGKLVRRVALDLDPEPVTEQERQAVVADLDRAIAAAPERSNERERVLGKIELGVRRANIELVDPKPAWTSVQLDDRGYLWLRRPHQVLFDYYGNYAFAHRVIDPSGEYLGDTSWPPLLQAAVVHGHLLAMVFDQTSLQVIPTVYRITPRAAGLVY